MKCKVEVMKKLKGNMTYKDIMDLTGLNRNTVAKIIRGEDSLISNVDKVLVALDPSVTLLDVIDDPILVQLESMKDIYAPMDRLTRMMCSEEWLYTLKDELFLVNYRWERELYRLFFRYIDNTNTPYTYVEGLYDVASHYRRGHGIYIDKSVFTTLCEVYKIATPEQAGIIFDSALEEKKEYNARVKMYTYNRDENI